jgi:nicotinamidase/pyrazinamidase
MVVDISRSALIIVDVQNDFCPPRRSADGSRSDPGALAVRQGDRVIPALNALSRYFSAQEGTVVATQDWHPEGHVSFASTHRGASLYEVRTLPAPLPGLSAAAPVSAADPAAAMPRPASPIRRGEQVPTTIDQVLWPNHCVQGTEGAALHPDLDMDQIHIILRKGYRHELDSYSVLFENDRLTPTGLDGLLKGLGIRTVYLGGLATDYCVLYSALDAVRVGYETVVLTDAVRGVDVPEGSVDRAMEQMAKAGVRFVESGSLL